MPEFRRREQILSDRPSAQRPAREIDRRGFLSAAAASGIGLSLGVMPARAANARISDTPVLRSIPGTAEHIPAIGMGTWITFNVGNNRRLRDARADVLRSFFDLGGTVIDSSPMYGSSEDFVGY